jgi:aminopeptidase YwaD
LVAVAITDTSEFRNPHYHSPTDTAETLNYDAMARMGDGFIRTVRVLASAETALH